MQPPRPPADQPPDVEREVPVLIVGGSLVGLSAALFLRWHGIDALTVERHSGTAIRARAGHFHLRTVEILRSVGLENAVRRRSEEQYHPDGGINNVESLAGREIGNFIPNLNAGVAEFSPTVRLFINKDALEPIIRARAEELGARLRYRTECTSLTQDAGGVTAVLSDLDSGTQTAVRARYVIAADGNRSTIRQRLGIGMHGHGLLSNSITVRAVGQRRRGDYRAAGAGVAARGHRRPGLPGRDRGHRDLACHRRRRRYVSGRTGFPAG